MNIKFINKEYLSTQFQNFAEKIANTFAKKTEVDQKSTVKANVDVDNTTPSLSTIQIDDDKYKIGIETLDAESVTLTPNALITSTNVQSAMNMISGDYVKITTASVSGGDAQLLITYNYGKDTLLIHHAGSPEQPPFPIEISCIKIVYDSYNGEWQLFAKDYCVFNNVTYKPNEFIAKWWFSLEVDYTVKSVPLFVVYENDKSLVSDTDKELWNNKSKVIPNIETTGLEKSLSSIQIDDVNYIIKGGEGGSSFAEDITMTPTTIIPSTNVQDAFEYISGAETTDFIIVKTLSIGGTSASVNVKYDKEHINAEVIYDKPETFNTFGFIDISYNPAKTSWHIVVLEKCIFNKTIYYPNDVIEWMYSATIEYKFYRYSSLEPLFVLNEHDKYLSAANPILEGNEPTLSSILIGKDKYKIQGGGGDVPTHLSDLEDDENHRLVTDDEKSTWNAKLDSSALDNYVNKNTTINGHSLSSNIDITTEDIGLDKVGNFLSVSTEANQNLTEEQKANARANIGAGSSGFSGNYNELSFRPLDKTSEELGNIINSKYELPKNGIPKDDLDESIKTSLGLADSALQSFTETDPTVPSHVKGITLENITDWNNKQNALNQNQLNATNSGITSSKVDIYDGYASEISAKYTKPETNIPKSDLSNDVQTSLGLADTALQSYTEQYTGTITGVSVNGSSISTSGVANITNIPASIVSGNLNNVTATTQKQGDNSTKIATTEYVDKAIDDLPEPMVFKGSLGTNGTITTLPTSSKENVGWTYKVITDGTYAGKAAKVGDTFISDSTEWVLIPSGDEPSGTVTSVGLKMPSAFTVSNTPITDSGNINVVMANGYSIPSNTKQSTWDNKQDALNANQLAATNSGITSAKVNTYDGYATTKSKVNANVTTQTTTPSLSSIEIDGSVYKIDSTSSLDAENVAMTPTSIIDTTDVQSAFEYISGAESDELGVIKTVTMGGSDATVNVSCPYQGINQNVYYVNVNIAKGNLPINYGFFQLCYLGSPTKWQVKALKTCKCNGIKYLANEIISEWNYNEPKELKIQGIENLQPLFVLNESGKSLVSNEEKDRWNNSLQKSLTMCTCDTAASVSEKVVTVNEGFNFKLEKGALILVKFSVTNSASNVTLNVNGTGAKPIYHNYQVYTSNSTAVCGYAERNFLYMYDGTNWVFLSNTVPNSDTYPSAYCTSSASSSSKSATCSGYSLLDNSYLHLVISNSNTANKAITLNVNSKGAKPIYINGFASSSTNYTLPAGSYLTYYDGTRYHIRTDGIIPGTIQNVQNTNDNLPSTSGNVTRYIPLFSGNTNGEYPCRSSENLRFWNAKVDTSDTAKESRLVIGNANKELKYEGDTLTNDNRFGSLYLYGIGENGVFLRPGTTALDANKVIYFPSSGGTMALTTSSSRKYKENIKAITEEEAKRILDVNVVSYDYINKKNYEDRLAVGRFGVIAEELNEIIPSAVLYDGEWKPDAVDYAAMVPQLIKMVQMQQEQINELKELVKRQ